ncbi:MAG: ribosome rescue protein RqcH [Candidatus Helarchaeota archaeon]
MSSFDIAAIISELEPVITDAWISNVYQLGTIFTIKFRTKVGTIEFLIEPQKRLHLTKYSRPKPRYPSKFCMTLRKYLRNKRVLYIGQHDFDRVVVIKVGRLNKDTNEILGENTVIIEFFERGNLVLLNAEGKVIVALNYKTMRDRRIIPNRIFNFAPPRGRDVKKLTFDEFKDIFKDSSQNLVRTLISNLNIAPIYAEEICFRAQLNKEMDILELSSGNIETLFNILKDLVSLTSKDAICAQIYQIDSKEYLTPMKLRQFSSVETKKYENFNEAADEFFSSKEEIQMRAEEVKDKKTELSKTEKILKNQQKAITQLGKNSVRYKRFGNILYQHFQEIDELVSTIKEARDKGHSWDKITKTFEKAKKQNIGASQFIKKINYNNATLLLDIDGEEFSIDFRKSVAENANIFYSKAKKEAAKLEGAKRAYQEILKKKDQVELETEIIRQKDKKLLEKRKKKWYEKFHWFISSDDFLVIGGRDIKTNELIVKKYMDESDLFFHATFRGAPVVVVKVNNREVPERTLQEAAQFEAVFSNAWKAQFGQVDVYWVQATQVSKTPPSGEYLQKGSFIIRGKRNPIKNIPLQLKVGVKFEDKFAVIMSGPPQAVEKHTEIVVGVKFGEKPNALVAKLIKQHFINSCSDEKHKKLIRNLPLDEIQRSIPGGTADLVN